MFAAGWGRPDAPDSAHRQQEPEDYALADTIEHFHVGLPGSVYVRTAGSPLW